MIGFSVPEKTEVIPTLSTIKAKASQWAGYCTKENWHSLTGDEKFYIAQSSGTTLMALDGLLAGDMGTLATGIGNTAKNLGFFKVREKLSEKFSEPEATLIADTVASSVSVATNLPQMLSNFQAAAGAVESAVGAENLADMAEGLATGDVVRFTSGFLAVSAYGIQAGYNLSKLSAHQMSEPPEKRIFPFDKVEAVRSQLSGVIPDSVQDKAQLSATFLKEVGEKYPGLALGVRAGMTVAGGVATANPVMAVSGAAFVAGAVYKYKANNQSPEQAHENNQSLGAINGEEGKGENGTGSDPLPTALVPNPA